MDKLKKRIFIKQWLDLKPYDNQTYTDNYYLKLSNEVKQVIMNKHSFVLQDYLDNDGIDALACFLTSYFEDLISETNIWNTFTKIHKRMYGKRLPFYETGDEYYEQEINFPDVCFLMWYFMNTIQLDTFIPPYYDFITETAEKAMEVFDNAWEYAPENEHLKTFYSIDESETDFYIARKLTDNVLFKTYLFYSDALMDLRESELEIEEKTENEEHLLSILDENRDQTLHNAYTRLLGLKGNEWVAEILGENHNLSKDFLGITKKISGYFFYKGQDEENVFIEHIASGKKFNLTKKSFDHSENLKEIDTILFMGIVRWRGEWWFSGIYFQPGFDPDLVLDEKNSMKSRSAVDFLDHQHKEIDDILKKQSKAFKKFNNNQQIAFMESDKIEAFVKDYTEFYNNSLKLSGKKKKEARQRAKDEGFFGDNNETEDFSEVSESGLVFFNPKSGVEIAMGVNSAFPMKNNPFFNEDESEEHIMFLFFAEEISVELAMFCVDNFKNDLNFFKGADGKLLLDNLDFLLRFWKRGNYFTKPSITLTGKEK
ncbi:MAG: DUF3843 family protein [Bacteroidota bacterium]